MREVRSCKIECRADETSPGRISGVLIEAGRIARDRQEVFTPGSIRWPHNGLRLLDKHYGNTVMRFHPKEDGAKLLIDEQLPDTAIGRRVAAEIRSGQRTDLSIEFFPSEESNVSGVREVRSALVDAVALNPPGTGIYTQAKAEVRAKSKAAPIWL